MDLGVTQKETARRIEANPWTVLNWERETTQIAVRFIPGVFQFLGYDPFPKGQILGERLRARWRRGLSHTALARRLKIDPTTLLTREQGRHRPPVTYWPRILALAGTEELPRDASLPDRRRACRQAYGLTQRELARLLGVSQNVVSAWERGVRQPDTWGSELVQRLNELLVL